MNAHVAPAANKPPLVKKPEAARQLGVCPRTVDNLVKAGRLDKIMLSARAARITQASLDRLVATV
ncbi:MAG: DNA-binding protein [Comamonadaceae bacterium]|nr:MAG: DNA-binding protein [Comamonadaceae bacterium]